MGTLDSSTLPEEDAFAIPEQFRLEEALGLAIAWSADEPERVGEVALLAGAASSDYVLGRGAERPDDVRPRLAFITQRPQQVELTGPLLSRKISRAQLVLRARGTDPLTVENVGRCALLRNGQTIESSELRPGDTLQLGTQLLLLCVKRPLMLARRGDVIKEVLDKFGR
jgi:hypothetical protein